VLRDLAVRQASRGAADLIAAYRCDTHCAQHA
jgi:hypothetical protein